MTTDPTTVTAERIHQALALLGIRDDPADITRVEITPQAIRVVRFRRDEQGAIAVAGDEAATISTTIGIDWTPKEASTP